MASLAAAPAAAAAPFDFDGDGRQDLAASTPGLEHRGAPSAGGVAILPGGRPGTLFTRATGGVPGEPSGDDRFGANLASGDFNGDGRADLAVGGEWLRDARVTVLYGSRRGLTGDGADTVGPDDATTLAAGDFNRDGFDDLAVTMILADSAPDYEGSGAIRLLFGGAQGLSQQGARTLTRPARGQDEFGQAMAVGDLNRDGHLDLVDSAFGSADVYDDPPDSGHVNFCPGTPAGPQSCTTLQPVVRGPGPGSLAVADIDGDGYDDIVGGIFIGGLYDDKPPAGTLVLYRGSASGPSEGTEFDQVTSRVRRGERPADWYGASVAAADLDRDGYGDVVVGSPGRNRDAGRVVVLRGGPRGRLLRRGDVLHQGSPGVPGRPRRATRFRGGNQFGAAVTLLRADGDRFPDLVVGLPGFRRGEGAIVTMRGSKRGFGRRPARLLGAHRLGIEAAGPDFLGLGSVLGRP